MGKISSYAIQLKFYILVIFKVFGQGQVENNLTQILENHSDALRGFPRRHILCGGSCVACSVLPSGTVWLGISS